MVLVNNPGDPAHVYSQLAHVPWHGLTFADVIAPWFLWVIGVTTTLSLSRRMEATARMSVFAHVVYRALVLYGLGVFLSVVPGLLEGSGSLILEDLKVMGILQRIAICYVLGAALFLGVGPRKGGAIAAVLLAMYWVILAWIPGPADGAGPFDPTLNRAQLLDLRLLGYFGESSSHALLTIPPATSTILLGALAGDLVRGGRTIQQRLFWLSVGGVGLCVVALLASEHIPINRRLWTPSFALLTSGIAMAVFAVLYWLLDVRRLRKGTGWLVAYGANPILLFVLSELGRIVAGTKGITDGTGEWHSYWMVAYESFLTFADPKTASALFAWGYVILFGVLAMRMYLRGWIVKI